MLQVCKKLSLSQEKKFLFDTLISCQKNETVYLVAECDNNIVGTTRIVLGEGRQEHIGKFGITIRKGYRGIGLGKFMMIEVMAITKKKLKPKIIKLEVFANNKPAISLYKKMGFKEVAKIPKQRLYKGKLIAEIVMLRDM